jgi:hypothetical protein
MALPTKEQVLALLRNGTAAERAAFLAQLPPASFKDAASGLFGADNNPGMVVVAITPLIQEYCFGSHPQIGAVLAEAAHERALEIARTVKDHGLLPTTLSGLACHHVRALTLLGRSAEVLSATDAYIPLYEQMNERENLSTLRVLRVTALVNLERIDEAEAALRDQALLDDPVNGIEAQRLKRWVDRYRADPTLTPSEWRPAPAEPNAPVLQAMLDKVLELGGMGSLGAAVRRQLDPAHRIDPADPEQHQRLLELLREGEQVLTRGAGADSEIAVRARIREATSIFVHGKPGADVLQRSLAELEQSLDAARRLGVTEHENDALWGVYLCHSRLGNPSLAADALIALRGNLERLRHGIQDPMKRGGIFSTYRYLFNALCEQLYRSGRAADLLEAIESSKGRVIADRLTASAGRVMEDGAAYSAVDGLPTLVRRERFHYLTYFVDESRVYAAFVTRDGAILAPEPAAITDDELRAAAAHVDPRQWPRGSAAPPTQLAPLVAWLEDLLTQGVVGRDDHICYSADDDFTNVPLHYLQFRDGILLDYFSVSRVHSAFHLERVLSRERTGAPDSFTGIVVPTRQDLQRTDADSFLKHLDAPLTWLARRGLSGKTLRDDATLGRIAVEPLAHRVVHFSTHGDFPLEGGNPFHDSFLLLAGESGLPDEASVTSGGHRGRLTPASILESDLNLEGSHVSMMACVSGLAREGIAGDALGLDWAFIQAGAASLVSTHWNVSAAAAARFFTRFYARWIDDGQPRASAFRATLLELLGGDRSPDALSQWSAFSLTGDFR